MRLAARLVLAAALAGSLAAVSPASATDCTNPKEPCGGCYVNREFTVERLDVVRCYS